MIYFFDLVFVLNFCLTYFLDVHETFTQINQEFLLSQYSVLMLLVSSFILYVHSKRFLSIDQRIKTKNVINIIDYEKIHLRYMHLQSNLF